MSHFSVMVLGEDPVGQLAPYHEFECTGDDDKYVQDIDKTEEIRADYESEKRDYYKTGSGEYVESYKATEADEEQGTLENLPVKQFMSMREYLTEQGYEPDHFLNRTQEPDLTGEHKFGYIRLDGDELVQVVRRTNPNPKWDWHQLGGRWSGFLRLKPEYSEAVGHARALEKRGKEVPDTLQAKIANIKMGERSWANASEALTRDRVDAAPKYAIDFDRMVNEHLSQVMPQFDECQRIINGRTWLTWTEMRTKHEGDIEAARTAFHEQSVYQDLNAGPLNRHFFFDWDKLKMTRDEYIAEQSLVAVSTFAMIKDGQWFEKGEMGWFGMSANDKAQAEWSGTLLEAINSVPEDTIISIYDCHI